MAAGAASGSVLGFVQTATTEPAPTTTVAPAPPPPPKPDPAPPPPPPPPSPTPATAPTPPPAADGASGGTSATAEPREKRGDDRSKEKGHSSDNSASPSALRALILRARNTSVREQWVGGDSTLSTYVSSPPSSSGLSRTTVALYLVLGLLLVGITIVPLARRARPELSLAAISGRLEHRPEFAFFGAATILGAAIGLATVLFVG